MALFKHCATHVNEKCDLLFRAANLQGKKEHYILGLQLS